MRGRTWLLAALAVAALLPVAAGMWLLLRPEADGRVGVLRAEAPSAVRGEDIAFDLWYPALPGGRAVTVGGNGVFHGTPAGRGAPPAPGRAPLVLVSHGAGGNAGQMGWIASAVAEAGYAVAIPNHPGTTSGNASAAAAVRLWERPPDLSAVIDALEADPGRFGFVDATRIAALGFSAGGYTVLALAGARGDPERLAAFCDDPAATGMSDCAFLAAGGVDLRALDLSPAGRDLRDGRVDAVVAIDPGTVGTITEGSLAAIAIPALLVNLGAEEAVPAAVRAREAAGRIPSATYHAIPDAGHFSFLAACKPAGAAILRDEGEPDPLCDDAGGRARPEIHAELAALIAEWLDGALGPARP